MISIETDMIPIGDGKPLRCVVHTPVVIETDMIPIGDGKALPKFLEAANLCIETDMIPIGDGK